MFEIYIYMQYKYVAYLYTYAITDRYTCINLMEIIKWKN